MQRRTKQFTTDGPIKADVNEQLRYSQHTKPCSEKCSTCRLRCETVRSSAVVVAAGSASAAAAAVAGNVDARHERIAVEPADDIAVGMTVGSALAALGPSSVGCNYIAVGIGYKIAVGTDTDRQASNTSRLIKISDIFWGVLRSFQSFHQRR